MPGQPPEDNSPPTPVFGVIERALSFADGTYTVVMLVLFGLLPVVVGLQILTRWVLAPEFGIRLQWASSLSQMLLIYVTFLGAGLASRDRDRISIELLFKHIPVSAARVLQVVQLLLVGWFLLVFIEGGLGMVDISGSVPFHTLPVTAPLTTAWVYRVAVLGAVLMLVYSLRDLFVTVRDPRGVLKIIGIEGEGDE